MRLTRAAYLWPGLPHAWCAGNWQGLALAVLAALPINLLIVSTFVWTEWLGSITWLLLWAVLALCWGASWVLARHQGRPLEEVKSVDGQDLFEKAQIEYLKGNWFEAEHVVHKLIRRNARDVDAHLLLASLFRHTRRYEESAAQLRRLALFDDARKWAMEIERERKLLDLAQQEALVESAGEPAAAHDAAEQVSDDVHPTGFTQAA